VSEREKEVAGMDLAVARMGVDRCKQLIGHRYKEIEPVDVDTDIMVSVIEDNPTMIELDQTSDQNVPKAPKSTWLLWKDAYYHPKTELFRHLEAKNDHRR